MKSTEAGWGAEGYGVQRDSDSFGRMSVMSWVGTRMCCLKPPGKAAALPGSQHAPAEGLTTVFLRSALPLCTARGSLLPMIQTALLVMPDLPEVWARDSG